MKNAEEMKCFFITELAGQHLSIYLIILLGEKCVYSSRSDDFTSHLNPATATPNFHFHVAKRVRALWAAALIAVVTHFHYLEFFFCCSRQKNTSRQNWWPRPDSSAALRFHISVFSPALHLCRFPSRTERQAHSYAVWYLWRGFH